MQNSYKFFKFLNLGSHQNSLTTALKYRNAFFCLLFIKFDASLSGSVIELLSSRVWTRCTRRNRLTWTWRKHGPQEPSSVQVKHFHRTDLQIRIKGINWIVLFSILTLTVFIIRAELWRAKKIASAFTRQVQKYPCRQRTFSIVFQLFFFALKTYVAFELITSDGFKNTALLKHLPRNFPDTAQGTVSYFYTCKRQIFF